MGECLKMIIRKGLQMVCLPVRSRRNLLFFLCSLLLYFAQLSSRTEWNIVALAKKEKGTSSSSADAFDDIQVLGPGDTLGADGKKKRTKMSKQEKENLEKLSKKAGHINNNDLFDEKINLNDEIEKAQK